MLDILQKKIHNIRELVFIFTISCEIGRELFNKNQQIKNQRRLDKKMKNLQSIFGKKDSNDYDKYYRDDDDIYGDAEETDEDVTTYGEKKTEGVSFGGGSSAVSLKVVKPKSYADGPAIADHLASGSTVVLNIESLDRSGAIRLIDFLMGAIHVLGGDMKSVTKTTLVFAPRNVGVTDFENVDEESGDESSYNDAE